MPSRNRLVTVTGIREIDRALRQLVPAVQKKVLRQAMRKAMKPIQARAKEQAPVETGKLRRSVKVRAMKRRVGRIGINVTVSDRDFPGQSFYGAAEEYGAKGAEGTHFMKRSYDTLGPSALNGAMREILNGINTQVTLLKAK